MKVKFLVCVLILSCAVAAHAAPKATLFGGYQYTRFDGGPNASGWNAALTGGFNSWIGIRADFSAVYPTGFNFYTYTFGPEVSVPHIPMVKPFAHLLLGGARATSGGAGTNGFDMMLGGGADVGHGIVAWRIVQFDWMHTSFNNVTDNKNVRICTGLALRF